MPLNLLCQQLVSNVANYKVFRVMSGESESSHQNPTFDFDFSLQIVVALLTSTRLAISFATRPGTLLR